jgi:hypothetical protein
MDLVSTTQLLGNVGEFIGGITVLATLVYLAYQTRQGTRALERAEARATMETFGQFWTSMQDPKTAALWLEGQAGELKPASAEHWSYTSLMVRYVYGMQSLWSSSRKKKLFLKKIGSPKPLVFKR